MHTRLEFEVGDDRGVDIHQLEGRMVGHDMAAAGFAGLAIADRCLVVGDDVVLALGDLHRIRRPEGEGIHRTRRPVAAGTAVAIAHGGGLTGYFDLDGTAETGTPIFIGHKNLRWGRREQRAWLTAPDWRVCKILQVANRTPSGRN